ncbi:MAG: hypothetical protein JZU58_24405 [Curvibacter lanceolatus]|nr:hypothetical protein [Curvibacter lanceolatus]MBV5295490.1 hypothetical protein [Curvibacter lanceolatus]
MTLRIIFALGAWGHAAAAPLKARANQREIDVNRITPAIEKRRGTWKTNF